MAVEGEAGIAQLAEIMKAMGNPVRTQLLRMLRTPRTLGEIQVTPVRNDSTLQGDRAMSRVSVRQHLEQLLAIGAVKQVNGVRDGRAVTLYQVNHRQLFALTEELRELGRLRPEQDLIADGTEPAPPPPPAPVTGPRLVLMNGAYEGRLFTLDKGREAEWVIGRKAGCAVCLDYDPYLSQENSAIRLEGGAFVLHDLPGNRNGTRLNWQDLPRGGRRELQTGDVIGIGRSQILFRDD